MTTPVEYREYPPKRVMAADLLRQLGLENDHRMFHNNYNYNLLEDIKKSCIIALWEKICQIRDEEE